MGPIACLDKAPEIELRNSATWNNKAFAVDALVRDDAPRAWPLSRRERLPGKAVFGTDGGIPELGASPSFFRMARSTTPAGFCGGPGFHPVSHGDLLRR